MKIGVIADTHLPFTHPMYRRFCLDTFDKFGCNTFVHVGDVVDNHAVAPNYDADPNGLSAKQETIKAKKGLAEWYKSFPKLLVCYGNHDLRPLRSSRKAGIPDLYMRTLPEVLGCPKTWKWDFRHCLDGVLIEHGTGSAGRDAAFNRAMQQRRSLVMGHTHSNAGVKWNSNPFNRIFGMNVGCGIDIRAYAFAYGKDYVNRPVLGCGVILDGTALFLPMPCGPKEKYHRSKA